MDHGAGTGLIGAAFTAAHSYQPNLLTRRTLDQAIITGATAAGAYGVFSTGGSVMASVASRLSRSDVPSTKALALVSGAATAAGAAAWWALRWREHEPNARALGRLTAQFTAAIGAASLTSTVSDAVSPDNDRDIAVAAALTGALAWASTQPWKARPGSLVDGPMPGAIKSGDEYFLEDQVREVSPAKTVAIGVAVAGLTFGLARTESALTRAMSRGAAFVLGGTAEDHQTTGRVSAAAATAALGWLAIGQASSLLAKGGGSIEPAHSTQPALPEISGSPASGLAWTRMTREGARWLSMALTPEGINSVMGISDARQPIRVYSSVELADTEAGRAQILLDEIDRTGALDRKVFALFSATGSGYVNYVATETLEYLTAGDCASACVQYSVLPSALSLGLVGTGTSQTQMVMSGIVERLMARTPDQRPHFVLFGESLGSQVSEEMFNGTDVLGLKGTALDAALWIGTPAATKWRRELWGTRTVAEAPGVGPGATYLPRNLVDWRALPDDQREEVKFLLLMNGDDPIPKFGPQVAWRRPDWLGPETIRPFGSPHGTRWIPGMTYLTTFFDMQSALVPTPGVFAEGGHDYRDVLPEAISTTWRLPATPEQRARIDKALRERELAWELHRNWTAAVAKPAQDQSAAQQKVLENASKYTSRKVDADELQAIIARGLQPTGD